MVNVNSLAREICYANIVSNNGSIHEELLNS